MIFADAHLARRLEWAEAAISRGTSGQSGTALLDVEGGCAIFAGVDSPLTQAVGVGLNGPVGEARIVEIETFFRSRGARVKFEVCPLADPDLVASLGERGYRVTEFNNVLVKRLAGTAAAEATRARRASAEEIELWSYTVGRGFFENRELSEEEMDIGRAIARMSGAACWLGVTAEGQVAAAGAMAAVNGVAALFADSTVAEFRGTGLHRELISARLAEAAAMECELATASTLPGSGSQRNYERMGFQVAYTRVTMAG
jgi:GNAT superfamily N-acetyltransferase